jgi:phage terminase large subunit-like protein
MFDVAQAERAVQFISLLKHTKGVWYGKPFELLPWQEKLIRDIFGTVKENGYRQYNTAYVEVPKKNGKSELAAAAGISFLLPDSPGHFDKPPLPFQCRWYALGTD